MHELITLWLMLLSIENHVSFPKWRFQNLEKNDDVTDDIIRPIFIKSSTIH